MKGHNLQFDIYQRLLSYMEKANVSPEKLLNKASKKGLSVSACLSVSAEKKTFGIGYHVFAGGSPGAFRRYGHCHAYRSGNQY